MLKRFQKSPKIHIATVGAMFGILLIFNVLTPLLSDDFLYSFSIVTWERLDSVEAVVESIIAHGQSVNGRYFAHFFAQLFLMLPAIVFDVINSLVFVSTIYIVYRICNRGREINNSFLIGIFGFVWLFELDFGQINLWLDGACNYLFAVFFGLLYILPFINSVMNQKRLNPFLVLPHMLISVILGGYLEPLSVGFVGASCLFLMLDLFYYKNRSSWWLLPSVLSSFLGLSIMVFAPAEKMNKLSSFSFLKVLSIFGIALFVMLCISPVILLYVFFYKRALREGMDPRVRITSLVLAAGALVSNFILLIAKNYPLRCSVSFVFLSIFATALLYGNLQNTDFGEKSKKYYRWLAVLLCVALTVGLADKICTHVCVMNNERVIEEAIEQGEMNVELDVPIPLTKYNGLRGITYLDTEGTENWPNTHFANYYGLESVIGKNRLREFLGLS